MASIEELLTANTEALNRNTEAVEKLVAGRDAAMAAIEKATEAKAPAPTRRKKAEAAAEPEPAAAPSASEVSEDDLRKAATAYVGAAGEDKDERTARGKNIKAITDNFGTKTLVGPEGITGAEERAQALFYLKRFNAGLTVDFGAEYDFSGDPAQSAAEAPAETAAEEEFDIG